MLRVFENKLMWRIFWPKRDEITGEWGKMWSLMICTPHPVLFG